MAYTSNLSQAHLSNSHIITYFSGHLQKTPNTGFYVNLHICFQKSQRRHPKSSCPNPDCPVGYRSFDTVKGYQNHLTHSPVCTEYASRQLSLQSLACQPTQPIATATIPTAVLDPGISTTTHCTKGKPT